MILNLSRCDVILSLNDSILVPNQAPLRPWISCSNRLAVIGEAPSFEEEHWCRCDRGHGYARFFWSHGSFAQRDRCPTCGSAAFEEWPEPFRGISGRLLDDCLKRCGVRREAVFLGNVSRVRRRPTDKDDVTSVSDIPLSILLRDLEPLRPNCLLLLGAAALCAFHPQRTAKIGLWRSSIWQSRLLPDGASYKCVATYHPASVFRSGPRAADEAGAQPSWLPLIRFDIKRAVEEAASPDLNLPQRRFLMPSSDGQLVAV